MFLPIKNNGHGNLSEEIFFYENDEGWKCINSDGDVVF